MLINVPVILELDVEDVENIVLELNYSLSKRFDEKKKIRICEVIDYLRDKLCDSSSYCNRCIWYDLENEECKKL